MPVRNILIADDHAITRKGTEQLVKAAYPYCLTAEAGNGKEAVTRYHELMPDVVLMDYNMPELNGFDASVAILREHKEARIILVTMFDTLPIIANFIKIGGRGFVWKGNPPQDICDGIRAVSTGDHFISSSHEREMAAWMKSGAAHKVPKLKFTPLELSIVVQLSKGKTSKEISRNLSLSCRTVETYRYDLIKKTEVRNSVELIEYVFKNGIASL